jgi:uncharacterized protein YbaP (TraB family)
MQKSFRKSNSMAAFIAAMLLMLMCSCASAQTHLVWQVSKGTQTFWMIGVSHHLLKEHEKIPQFIERIYQNSTVVVPESILFTGQTLARITRTEYVIPTQNSIELIKNLLNEKRISNEHSRLLLEIPVEELQHHVDEIMDYVRPKNVALVTYSEGFDAQLTKRAYKEKKPIDTLEKRQRIREVWRETCGSEKDREEILSSIAVALSNPPNFVALNEQKLVADYNGDIKAIEQIERGWMKFVPFGHYSIKCSAIPRTKEWLTTIPSLLKKHTSPLFLLGWSHVIGDEGLVELMGKDGYTFTRVYPEAK